MHTLEFFFDFGSPYSYLAYRRLPHITQAHGTEILWRPLLLGRVFQATGNSSPATVPLKARYALTDLERWAAHYQTPFRHNPNFPINTLQLMRGATGMQMYYKEQFLHYLSTVFSAMFENPQNMGDMAIVREVLNAAGISFDLFNELINTPAVKEQLKQDTEAAIARGVFGVPTFFVEDEMFWGQDRLLFVEAALAAPA